MAVTALERTQTKIHLEADRPTDRQTDLPDKDEGEGGKVGTKKTGMRRGGGSERDKEREGGKCGAGGGSEAGEGDIYFLYDPLQSHSAAAEPVPLSGAAWWWMCPES